MVNFFPLSSRSVQWECDFGGKLAPSSNDIERMRVLIGQGQKNRRQLGDAGILRFHGSDC